MYGLVCKHIHVNIIPAGMPILCSAACLIERLCCYLLDWTLVLLLATHEWLLLGCLMLGSMASGRINHMGLEDQSSTWKIRRQMGLYYLFLIIFFVLTLYHIAYFLFYFIYIRLITEWLFLENSVSHVRMCTLPCLRPCIHASLLISCAVMLSVRVFSLYFCLN